MLFVSVFSMQMVMAADDYPWPSADPNQLSPLKFAYRNCTDFVAWRLNKQEGVTSSPWSFTWGTLGFAAGKGNAADWKDAAVADGYTVNNTAAVGAVAWWGSERASGLGHVAIVSSVNGDGTSNIEQYNAAFDNNYSTQNSVTPDAYIHIHDIGSAGYTGVGNATYTGGDSMASGTTMLPGYYLASTNLQGALIFQTDSNLVLYYGGNVVWQSGTHGANANRLVMQTDGNLVMYRADNTAVWNFNTGGHQGAGLYANLQNDGNFVVRSSTTVYNQTGSGGHPNQNYFGSNQMTGGQQFTQSYYMRSSDNRYAVLLQTDGNVVLYSAGYHPLWWTSPALGDTFTEQTDGNLVLYALGTPKWQSISSGHPGAYAVIQTDGNFVVYSSTNFPLWVSNTGGKI